MMGGKPQRETNVSKRNHGRCLRDAILKIAEQNSLDDLTLLYIRLYCVGAVQISCEWILGRHPISVAQLAEV